MILIGVVSATACDKFGSENRSNNLPRARHQIESLNSRFESMEGQIDTWNNLSPQEKYQKNAEKLQKAATTVCKKSTNLSFNSAEVVVVGDMFNLYLNFSEYQFAFQIPLSKDFITEGEAKRAVREGIEGHNFPIILE